jgi:hypothetical protein
MLIQPEDEKQAQMTPEESHSPNYGTSIETQWK